MAQLPDGSFSERAEVVSEIAATGDPRAAAVLEALGEGELHAAQGGRRDHPRHRARLEGGGLRRADRRRARPGRRPLDRGDQGQQRAAPRRPLGAVGADADATPTPAKRMAAAAEAFKNPDPEGVAALDAAIAAETDAGVRALMEEARASAVLAGDAPTGRQGRGHRHRRRARARRAAASDAADQRGRCRDRRPPRPRRSPRSSGGKRCGASGRTSGSACRSARCCCLPRSASRSPSA